MGRRQGCRGFESHHPLQGCSCHRGQPIATTDPTMALASGHLRQRLTGNPVVVPVQAKRVAGVGIQAGLWLGGSSIPSSLGLMPASRSTS